MNAAKEVGVHVAAGLALCLSPLILGLVASRNGCRSNGATRSHGSPEHANGGPEQRNDPSVHVVDFVGVLGLCGRLSRLYCRPGPDLSGSTSKIGRESCEAHTSFTREP